MPWRVYYDGGGVFSSDEGTPSDAPAWGVLVVLDSEPEREYQNPIHSKDYYLYVDGGWVGVDFTGLLDRLTQMGLVKVGRTVHEAEFMRAVERAIRDRNDG